MSTVAAPKKINPLLAAYLTSLAAHPLRTKAITTSMSTRASPRAIHTVSP